MHNPRICEPGDCSRSTCRSDVNMCVSKFNSIDGICLYFVPTFSLI